MNLKNFIVKANEIIKNPQDIAPYVVKNSCKIRGIRVDREKFLRRELSKYYKNNPEIIDRVIDTDPCCAGVPIKLINKIADNCINYEKLRTTICAAGLGLPGAVSGPAIAGIIISDLAQYHVYLMRIMQKLLYLYGYPEINNVEDEIDDETKTKLIVFLGVMYGVNGASNLLTAGVKIYSENLTKQVLTKANWYPIVQQLCQTIGIKATKEGIAKKIGGKIVPVIGAAVNGTLTNQAFKWQANKLKNYLIGFYGKEFLLTDDLS